MSHESARILVVDDVPENVRLLQALLEPRGYEVVVAGAAVWPIALRPVEQRLARPKLRLELLDDRGLELSIRPLEDRVPTAVRRSSPRVTLRLAGVRAVGVI
jgi:CheY-like chemotaxis protein